MTREHWSGQIDRYLCSRVLCGRKSEKLIGRYAEMLAVFLMENPMTTNVIVQAHCSEINKVVVTITEEGQETEVSVLQDGESSEYLAYDARCISVQEVPKE